MLSHFRFYAKDTERGGFLSYRQDRMKSYQIIQFSEIEIIIGDRLLNTLNNEHREPLERVKLFFGGWIPKNK